MGEALAIVANPSVSIHSINSATLMLLCDFEFGEQI